MSTALTMPTHRMTLAEFFDWADADPTGARWQLRDGEPEMMANATDPHGSIQARLTYLVTGHIEQHGIAARVVTNPGVATGERSEYNCLVPDIGVTTAPPTRSRMTPEPLLLIEVLSPSNVSMTRANVRDYRTIPTLKEIAVLRSTSVAAEILRRQPDGAWPGKPEHVGPDGTLRFDSIGFAVPLRDAYRTTDLA